MKLHLTSDSITIHVAENSSHYLHVYRVLTRSLGRPFWVNDMLINFEISHEHQKRQTFLTSLYYSCAFASKSHNASFLEKLLLASTKPIKLVKKKRQQRSFHTPMALTTNPYTLLNADETESLKSIRQKYLSLAKAFHPDSVASDDVRIVKNFTEKFQKIQEAYATIKAEKMRKLAA